MSNISVNGASNVIAGSVGAVTTNSGTLGEYSITMDQPSARPAKHSNIFSKIQDFVRDLKTSFNEWRTEVAENKTAAKQEKIDKTMTKSGRTLLHELTKPNADLSKISQALVCAHKAGGDNFMTALSEKITTLTAGQTADLLEGIARADGSSVEQIDSTASRIEGEGYSAGMDFDMAAVRDRVLLESYGKVQAHLQELAGSLPKSA